MSENTRCCQKNTKKRTSSLKKRLTRRIGWSNGKVNKILSNLSKKLLIKINFDITATSAIPRNELQMKLYKMHRNQELTEESALGVLLDPGEQHRPKHPNKYDCSRKQGAKRWCTGRAAIVDCRIYVLFCAMLFLPFTPNAILPEVRIFSSHRQYYYQQDGAPCHYFEKCLNFFRRHFSDEGSLLVLG